MLIAIVTEGYPPDPGGVATSAARIAKALTAAGCQVIVVTYDTSGETDFAAPLSTSRDGEVTVLRIGPLKLGGKGLDASGLARQRAILRRRFVDTAVAALTEAGTRPALIFSMYVLNAGFLATFLAARLDVPHVVGVRGGDIGRNLYDPALLYATGFVLERADAICCVNGHLRRVMLEAFPALADKTTIIGNGCAAPSAPDRAASRPRIMNASGWTDDALVLCFNGAFREKKGAFEIVDAMRRLEEQDSRARLLLVGSIPGGLEEAAIGDSVAGLVERGMCHRTGDIARKEVPEWLAGSDVLLLPSLDDGMANALLEGMQAGLCPLVSQIFADVVPEGSDEIIIPQPTGAKIADKVAWLERNRPLVSMLGEAARQRSLDLTPELEAANYLELFERVAAPGGRARAV